jgi:DNA transformation protein and related proteins
MNAKITPLSAGVAGRTVIVPWDASDMAISQDFLAFVLEQLEALGRVSHRRMFGAAGLYRDGLFFGLVDGDTLYFKTDDANRADYEAAGGEAFDPFPERPNQGPFSYFSVPIEVIEQPDELAEWARKALAAAARKPPAKPRRRARS